MKIGIDISQLAYPNTGVAKYLKNLVWELINLDEKNEYILFYSSLRKPLNTSILKDLSRSNVEIKQFKLPPLILDVIWNKLHIFPIESFIGPIDIFISSDWTQPPTKAKKITIIYDLVVYKYPMETARKIIGVQKRKLNWVKKEIDRIICISESSKKDVEKLLNFSSDKVSVIYPGI